jgi:hypothetical protein
MKMRHTMFAVEHANHDPEEAREFRHFDSSSSFDSHRHNARHQPQRHRMLARDAVGCKPDVMPPLSEDAACE